MTLEYLLFRFCMATAISTIFVLTCLMDKFHGPVSVIIFTLITIMMIVKAGLAYNDFQRRTDV